MSSGPPAKPSSQPNVVSRRVVSFDGTEIHYDIWDVPSRSLVLIVPGFWRDRRHPSMFRLAQFLNAAGYRCAIVDVRGHGDSGGLYGFNLHEHYDVAAVADDLLRHLPIESITLLGFSYGGSIAIATAARHQLPISSLLLVSPVADFGMIVPKINPFTIHRHLAFRQALRRPRFDWIRVRRSAKLRALDDIRDVHAPVCFVHVKDDWLINHNHSLVLHEHAHDPKECHILDVGGNYHADRIFSVASDAIEPIVRAFLEKHTLR